MKRKSKDTIIAELRVHFMNLNEELAELKKMVNYTVVVVMSPPDAELPNYPSMSYVIQGHSGLKDIDKLRKAAKKGSCGIRMFTIGPSRFDEVVYELEGYSKTKHQG